MFEIEDAANREGLSPLTEVAIRGILKSSGVRCSEVFQNDLQFFVFRCYTKK